MNETLQVLGVIGGVVLLAVTLWDAFETLILPRRVSRQIRLTRLYYRSTWIAWSSLARSIGKRGQRETVLAYFGPLSLLLLIGLWAGLLLVGFAIVQWGLGSSVTSSSGPAGFGADVYMSGTTLFTLGLGDVVPRTGAARAVTVIEVGSGLAFLALVIGYLPVMYQSFSRREVSISLLDARAGSPPTAGELLRRYGTDNDLSGLLEFLHEWEHWSAELLESHLSYPVLGYFRSQHENQSWIAALTAVLDTCALLMVGAEDGPRRVARLTFAMGRHVAADVSQVFSQAPRAPAQDRLPPVDLAQLCNLLAGVNLSLRLEEEAKHELARLRGLYEPYVSALADYLLMPLPAWFVPSAAQDDWERTAWQESLGLTLRD